MEKIGILVFYIDVTGIAPEDADKHIQEVVLEIEGSPEDKTVDSPLDLWEKLFIPIKATSHVQVIRNCCQCCENGTHLSGKKIKKLLSKRNSSN